MHNFKLLFAEDAQQDIVSLKGSAERFEAQNHCQIDLHIFDSVDEAQKALQDPAAGFHGVIADLMFSGDGLAGYQIVEAIESSNQRIPVVIVTGTPSDDDSEYALVAFRTKGDENVYYDCINDLYNLNKLGVSDLFGFRGELELSLNKVYKDFVIPVLPKWIEYGRNDSELAKAALRRHIFAHMIHLMDHGSGGELSVPEEVYIKTPTAEHVRPGALVQNRDDSSWWIVMNPACDLVLRKRKGTSDISTAPESKTEWLLLASIEAIASHIAMITNGKGNRNDHETKFINLMRNAAGLNCHALPPTGFFDGGIVNFRRLITLSEEEFKAQYIKPNVFVAASFLKDIQARFSSYYGRQGQPDLHGIENLFDMYAPSVSQ